MIHPSTQRLEKALGVSKEYLDLERKRLGRVGFRGPGRLSVVARVVLAWEGLRGGGQLPADVAHAVGYSGLPALDRTLVKVAGVAARELALLTDMEVAVRLRAAIRRGLDSEKGEMGGKKG